MDPESTAQEIANTQSSELDLSWREYQQLVYWLLCQETQVEAEPSYHSEVMEFEDGGVIDIVLRLKLPSLKLFGEDMLQRERQVFIECKRYRSTLTLDTVGKVFCHSILEEPEALWIVSPKRLSSQARDYAKQIFQIPESSQSSTLLRHTHFRHWRLGDLVARRAPAHNVEKLRIADWQVLLSTAFGSTVIASPTLQPSPYLRGVEIDSQTICHVRLLLAPECGSVNQLDLALICRKLNGDSVSVPLEESKRIDAEEIWATIPTQRILGCRALALIISAPTLAVEKQIQLAPYTLQFSSLIVGELRPHGAESIVDELLSSEGSKQVVSLLGPAGVGKSWLIEQVALSLTQKLGWECRAHTVTDTTDTSILFDILESISLSKSPRPFSTEDNLTNDSSRNIVAAIAFRFSGLRSPQDVQHLIEEAARGTINEAQVQQMVRIISRVAQQRATPLIITLRDVHSAAPSLSQALLRLFLWLRDDDCRNVRFLIEARCENPASSTTWPKSILELAERLGKNFGTIDVKPLSLAELRSALWQQVTAPNFDDVARTLHKLTGGYPLIIGQLFRDLLDRGIVAENHSSCPRYSLDPNGLVGTRLNKVAPQTSRFLRDRICTMGKSDREQQVIIACLGVVAQLLRVLPDGPPRSIVVEIVAQGLHLETSEVEVGITLATARGFLWPKEAGETLIFVHDAMRVASTELAHDHPAFIRVAEWMISSESVLQADVDKFRRDLFLAYVAHEIGRAGEAIRLALSAEARTADSGNLVERRLSLECALAALSSDPTPSNEWVLLELAVRERLIWTTMQQASQHFALSVIDAADHRVDSLFEAKMISRSTHAAARFHYARCQVVIGTRGLEPLGLLSALPAMCEHAADPAQLHYALTRLLLVAVDLDDAEIASEAITYCLRLPELRESANSLLSFLSDVGDLFSIEDAAVMLGIRKVALKLAKVTANRATSTDRSTAHATVNFLISKAQMEPNSLGDEYLASLCAEYSRQGYINPLVRLMNLSGLVAAQRAGLKDKKYAHNIWKNCVELADATGQRSAKWKACQNLATLGCQFPSTHASGDWQCCANEIVDSFLTHRDALRRKLCECLVILSRRPVFETDAREDLLPISLDTVKSVQHTSLVMKQVSIRGSENDESPFFFV